jgi:uncharacterized protein involved in exopolysaccharide biosynthesis
MENGSPLTKADLIAALTEVGVVTKTDLGSAMTGLRSEFKSATSELRNEFKSAMTGLRSELKTDMQSLEDRMMQEMRQIETNLLTEFHRYGKGQQLRLHSLESRDAALTERLAVIEERLLHLETHRPPSV